MAATISNAPVCPGLDIKESSGDHGRVQVGNLVPDVGLQRIQGSWSWVVNSVFDVSPQEKVTRVEVRTARRPVKSPRVPGVPELG